MLPMQADPILEWQRLVAHYRELGDEELRELAADFNDLTESAQQALRNEMQSRGLGDAIVASNAPRASDSPLATSAAPIDAGAENESCAPIHDPALNPLAFGGRPPELVPNTPNAGGEVDGPIDYTWKTVLCDCETPEEAWQLSEALKQVGIQSWIDEPRPRSGYASFDLPSPRVLVAADQLEQARPIAARPIPPEIVEESETKVPDFEPPRCPKCGALDPVLEAVDPANSWRCEQCGQQWTESAPAEAQAAE